MLPLKVVSSSFVHEGVIPVKFTGEGRDVSPALSWSGVPAAAQSMAVICDDPDAPSGNWIHWIIYNLPPDVAKIEENIPKMAVLPNGVSQGVNTWGRFGYNGPLPPPGPFHRYFFKIYALDQIITLQGKVTKEMLEKAMDGHILAQGALMGKFKRG